MVSRCEARSDLVLWDCAQAQACPVVDWFGGACGGQSPRWGGWGVGASTLPRSWGCPALKARAQGGLPRCAEGAQILITPSSTEGNFYKPDMSVFKNGGKRDGML